MGRLLLLSMFFVASSIQAQECVEPVAGRTSQAYICENAEPFDLQLFMAPIANGGPASEPGGYFVIGRTGSEPALASGNTWFDPSKDEAGTYYYRVDSDVPGCNEFDTAQMTVFFGDSANAGVGGEYKYFSTDGPINLMDLLGETAQPGGTWDPAIPEGGEFDPSIHGAGIFTYTYSVVTRTDVSNGTIGQQIITCEDSATIEITVIEPVEDEKVILCHKGKTLEVDEDAVQAHLDHGDTLGECSSTSASKTVVSPNPSRGEFNFSNELTEINKIRILNFQGGVETEFTNTGDPNLLEVNLGQLRKGIYFAEVITANGKEVLRLIKK